ncbi:monocarboxylate transporter 10-like isoform X2 [Mercenaria mercenaria]|uniref:monocarboxylate transporter 10-like isoform X2 n=1 Tax=Mercenaria mercenaria TaxID=6596 RepID=UPI00234ED9CE|nr:monocarboxylate transporter 10-like isoform X2 [Mercenaria mercenaria]
MGKSGKVEKRYFWQKKETDQNNHQNTDLLRKDEERAVQSDSNEDAPFTPPDGGWGWIVCLTSLWANGTVFGIINTFGIVYVQMRDHYSENDPEVSLKTAFVGSTCTGVTFLMCTVSSILSDRLGIRKTACTGAVLATVGLIATAFIKKLELLYLTYGLILGVGSSLVYSPSLVILGHYFRKHMGLVNGIVSFGSSLFTIALTRILPYLLSAVDIKYCFIFLAGLHFMLIIFTLSWKPLFIKENHLAAMTLSTESVYQHCNDCCTWTKKFLNVKIWKNRAYVIWIVSLGVALFGYFVPFFHLPKYTKDNFPGEDGSWLILCLSITSGVSRIVCGKLADIPWISRIKMQQLAFLVLGISTLCIPFAKSFGALIGISLVMGICDGVFVCLLGPIAFDIVGPGEASQAIGFLLGIFSIPFTIGPPVAGQLYDTMGNYNLAFHIAGAPPILGAVIMFLIPKVEQSFPAVTETMEFASMSVMDIYNEVKVPAKPATKDVKNGVPSGPSTEIQILTSQELIYPDKQQGIEEENPLRDNTDEPCIKFSDVQVIASEETSPVLEDSHQNLDKQPENCEENTNQNSNVHKGKYGTDTEQKQPEDQSNIGEATSLLDEVSKYLDSKVTFDSEEQTSL